MTTISTPPNTHKIGNYSVSVVQNHQNTFLANLNYTHTESKQTTDFFQCLLVKNVLICTRKNNEKNNSQNKNVLKTHGEFNLLKSVFFVKWRKKPNRKRQIQILL